MSRIKLRSSSSQFIVSKFYTASQCIFILVHGSFHHSVCSSMQAQLHTAHLCLAPFSYSFDQPTVSHSVFHYLLHTVQSSHVLFLYSKSRFILWNKSQSFSKKQLLSPQILLFKEHNSSTQMDLRNSSNYVRLDRKRIEFACEIN